MKLALIVALLATLTTFAGAKGTCEDCCDSCTDCCGDACEHCCQAE